MPEPRVAVVPDSRPAMHTAFAAAVVDGGGRLVDVADAEALVWADPAAGARFPEVVAEAAGVRWIQLPFAGIEPFAAHLDPRWVWTCGKGVYARPVAEHVLALTLAGLRGITHYSRARSWTGPVGANLLGARVVLLGGGGIARAALDLLEPFGCEVTVVRRHPSPMTGATRVVGPDRLDEVVESVDVVIVAWALTAETAGRVDGALLARMGPGCWLVNVGRGGHVVTDDLVAALSDGVLGGAALDVTEPEPLPEGHALWSTPNCLITPHIANTPEMGLPLIAERVRDNVARWAAGEPLLGLVDVALGY